MRHLLCIHANFSAPTRPLLSSCAILGILRTASRTCRQRAGKTGRFWDTSDTCHTPEHFYRSRILSCMSRIVPRAAKAFADSQAKSWEHRRSSGHFRHSGTLLQCSPVLRRHLGYSWAFCLPVSLPRHRRRLFCCYICVSVATHSPPDCLLA